MPNKDKKSSHQQRQIQSGAVKSMQLLQIYREYVKVVSSFGCNKNSLSFVLRI